MSFSITIPIFASVMEQHVKRIAETHFSPRSFTWLMPCSIPIQAVSDDSILLVADFDSYSSLASNFRGIVLCKTNKQFDSLRALENVLAVLTEKDVEEFSLVAQSEIVSLMNWNAAMDEIIIMRGTYRDLLECAVPVLGNYMTLTDSAFRLVAYTSSLTIDDPITNQFVANGFHDEETVQRFRDAGLIARWNAKAPAQSTAVDRGITKYPVVTHVIRQNGEYLMQLVMSCNRIPCTQALIDLFDIVVGKVRSMASLQGDVPALRTQGSALLSHLIEGKRYSLAYINLQMQLLQISPDERFRLFTIETTQDDNSIANLAMKFDFGSPEYLMLLEKKSLHLLVHASPGEIRKVNERVRYTIEDVCKNTPALVGASSFFHDLKEVHFAAQQNAIATRYRRESEAREDTAHSRNSGPDFVHFIDVLFDYVVANRERDIDFTRFCMRNSINRELLEADQAHHTNDYELVRVYLENERNISHTASIMGVHRNTVVNRIDRIKRTYGIDFDKYECRNAFMIIYSLDRLIGAE